MEHPVLPCNPFKLCEQATECHQISEVVSCIFHSILFHRTLGKFHYRQEGKYSIGTIGYEDIDCDFIDLTYVSRKQNFYFKTISNCWPGNGVMGTFLILQFR